MATVLRLPPPSPFCHSERTRISYLTGLTGAAYVVLLKENHMQLFEAATLDRKSGEAEESAVRHSGAPNSSLNNPLFPVTSSARYACGPPKWMKKASVRQAAEKHCLKGTGL